MLYTFLLKLSAVLLPHVYSSLLKDEALVDALLSRL